MKYIRIPKELFENPEYKKLSANSKLLYGLLLDRHSLSKKNNLTDDDGETIVYFTRENAREMLGIGKDVIFKCFADLKKAGLLQEGFVGVGKARILYIKNPTCKVEKHAPVRSGNADRNNTELNNTDINKTDLNNRACEFDNFYYTVLPTSYDADDRPF